MVMMGLDISLGMIPCCENHYEPEHPEELNHSWGLGGGGGSQRQICFV